MQVQEIAAKHGVSVHKVLSLLSEVGIEGKEDSSILEPSEIEKLESKLSTIPRAPAGRRGPVKILRPGAGARIVRRKPVSKARPRSTQTATPPPAAEDEKQVAEKTSRKPEERTREVDIRRSQAGSRARELLRAKRMRESGISRRSHEPEPVEESAKTPADPTAQPESPAPESQASAEQPAPQAPPSEPAKLSDRTETAVPEPAEPREPTAKEETSDVVRPEEPAAVAPPVAEKEKKEHKVKSKKQKQEELLERKLERTTTAQERKVLASIMGRKKGRKQRYKRTKKERIAAAEEAQKEQIERERTTLRIHEASTVADVAHGLGVNPSEIQKILLDLGKIVTVNQRLDPECIEIIADEFGFEVERVSLLDVNLFEDLEEEDNPEDLEPRPPVVTVMGHVDHGKTKLMDRIREANVASTEAGGITQHIGAYYVKMKDGAICFLDTPGHEAFTAMRARGAMVTDVVVLVVAADDGVMPQTKEAIAHARAADVPIIVAINKIDLPSANVENVKQQLAAEQLVPEEWGGETPMVEISALQGTGIEQLIELIQLQAEILELKANPKKRARGTVLEARLEEGRGVVATALIQDGTLHLGDPIVAGIHAGKVRALVTDQGHNIKEAPPGVPVAVLGISGVPVAGDELHGVPTEKVARELSQRLQQLHREREMSRVAHVSLESLFDRIEEGSIKDLNVIVKGDVDGSVGAVCEALERIQSDKVKLNILHRGVGMVSESDVMLASASDAIVLGFGVAVPASVASVAEREGVDIRTYRVIYDAIEDIKNAMLGLLEDEEREVVLGQLEVLQVFRSSKSGTIIGGRVTSGKIVKDSNIRVIRDGRIIHEGKIATLRRFKDEATEVTEGLECGIGIKNFNDIRQGDILECYQMETVTATL